MFLFALSVITAGLGIYYRDSCTVPYGCLGQSGVLLYVRCGQPVCDVNHTAVDLRQCQDTVGPENRSDTWLDKGCELLGGGCTRRFVKGTGKTPWCVPIALDDKGTYAPAVRVGTTKCRIECGQDYGILNASGEMKCACPSSTPTPCDLSYTVKEVHGMPSCFCRSPKPCNSSDCPCIAERGMISRTLDSLTGRLDLRALYPFDDLFRVTPCRGPKEEDSGQCPANWTSHEIDEESRLAMARGYRFYRPSTGLFYQPIGLNVSDLRANVCICIEHCLGAFPKVLCLMPSWDPRPVKCVPDFPLLTSSDLRYAAFDVQWEDNTIGKIGTFNKTVWTCSVELSKKCEIETRISLDSTPKCTCLSPCIAPSCGCYPNGYRLFKRYDPKAMQFSLCSLSGNNANTLWKVSACQGGKMLCPDGAEVKHLDPYERKVFALGYRFYFAKKWLRAFPISRPLRQGECVCFDQCEYGTPLLQCRLAPDPNVTLSMCQTPKESPRGMGLEAVSIEKVPQLRCDQSKEKVVPCDDQ